MYNRTKARKAVNNEMNLVLTIMLILIVIFSYRVINILSSNKERGGFAYVQLLNFDMPIVETSIYDEGAYLENKLSVKRVCYEALGLTKINTAAIVGSEAPFYKLISNGETASVNNSSSFNPFNLDENSISKVDNTENTGERATATTAAAYDPSLKKQHHLQQHGWT